VHRDPGEVNAEIADPVLAASALSTSNDPPQGAARPFSKNPEAS